MTDDIDDPRVHEGVEHLRRAAREMIAASRAFLDVVEEVVERPDAVGDVLGMVGSIGEQLRRGAAGAAGAGCAPRRGDPDADDDDPTDGGIFRIPVD